MSQIPVPNNTAGPGCFYSNAINNPQAMGAGNGSNMDGFSFGDDAPMFSQMQGGSGGLDSFSGGGSNGLTPGGMSDGMPGGLAGGMGGGSSPMGGSGSASEDYLNSLLNISPLQNQTNQMSGGATADPSSPLNYVNSTIEPIMQGAEASDQKAMQIANSGNSKSK